MKTFKQFLNEAPDNNWEVSWKQDLVYHILNLQEYFFYVSPNILDKILGIPKPIPAFHVCTILGLKRLKAIQHTRKTISSFTKIGNDFRLDTLVGGFSGNHPEPDKQMDVLVKLTGNITVGGSGDLMSRPDTKGIRGIEFAERDITQKYGRVLVTFLEKFRDKLIHEIIDLEKEHIVFQIISTISFPTNFSYTRTLYDYIKYLLDDPQNLLYKLEDYYLQYNDYDKGMQMAKDECTKSIIILKKFYTKWFQYMLIKEYRELIIKFIQNNIEYFREMRNPEQYEEVMTYGINEVLLNNFTIDKILILSAFKEPFEETYSKILQLHLGQKVYAYQELVNMFDEGQSNIDLKIRDIAQRMITEYREN